MSRPIARPAARPVARALRFSAALVATLALATACKVSTDGDAGTLNFAYQDPDNLLTRALDAPIAVGTRVKLKIRAADRKTAAQVTRASVDGAAKLIAIDGDAVIIEGVGAGFAELTVETDKGTDAVDLVVEAADTVSLKALNEADRALVGGIEPLSVVRTAGGEVLVGEARIDGVELSEGLVERVDGPDHRVSVRYLTEGEASVKLGDATITRTIVGLGVVETFEAMTLATEGVVDQQMIGYFQAKDVGGEPLAGLGGLVETQVVDEAICTIRAGELFGIEGAVLDLHAEGTCTVDLTLGEHTEQWSFAVKPAGK